MSDLKPMLLNVCRMCRDGTREDCVEPACAIFGIEHGAPLKPAYTREDMIGLALDADLPWASIDPPASAEAFLVDIGVIEPREQVDNGK